ncbi:MAG: DNA-processing protein DprA [Saprospiraceae bacterium]|nr:DNA-processing protein DprA [Saprospiraceae bacterium]
MDSLQHQIALMLVPQIGAVSAKTLVSYCGSAEAVFRASKRELYKIPGIGAAIIDSLAVSVEPLTRAEREIAFMEQYAVKAVFYTDPAYPARLRQCADSPAMFFFKGSSLSIFDLPRIVAIVGTRQPSEHGKSLCEEIVEGLQDYNVLIVSGLAFGVDVTVHRKASSIGIANVGVLGHGLGSIYPSQHRSVAQRMVENGGLVSEYAHDAKPDREHFPMRNRIISGLSDVLLVVETANSGGSMITVQYAERHGREIFAVPGRPHDAKSVGCNHLIKNERAKLAESAADIADRMQWGEPGKPPSSGKPMAGKPTQAQLFSDLTQDETALVSIIREKPEIPIDQLTLAARFTPGVLASHILNLEFKGIIRTLPGKRYIVSA